MSKFQGVIVPIVTPFNRDDAQTINYEAGEKLVEKVIAAGADGIDEKCIAMLDHYGIAHK